MAVSSTLSFLVQVEGGDPFSFKAVLEQGVPVRITETVPANTKRSINLEIHETFQLTLLAMTASTYDEKLTCTLDNDDDAGAANKLFGPLILFGSDIAKMAGADKKGVITGISVSNQTNADVTVNVLALHQPVV